MTHLPTPHQPSYKWWFSVYCSKPKIQKRRWGDCGLGDGAKWVGPASLLSPFIPLLLTLQSPGVRPGDRASGKSLQGQKEQQEFSGSPWGVPWARGGPRSCRGAECPSQSPKASRAGGEGQAPCWATEKRRLGRQDAGLFTVGSQGHQSPLVGTRRLFTQQEGKEPEPRSCTPPCPEWEGEGRPGSCSLSLGLQMETSYSRVSWRESRDQLLERDGEGGGNKMGGGIHQGGERPWVFKITLAMRFGSHGGEQGTGSYLAPGTPASSYGILKITHKFEFLGCPEQPEDLAVGPKFPLQTRWGTSWPLSPSPHHAATPHRARLTRCVHCCGLCRPLSLKSPSRVVQRL